MKNVVYEIQKTVWRILNPTAEPFEYIYGNWSERHDALEYSTRFAAIATALMVAVFFAVTPIDEAEAAPLSANAGMSTAAPAYSLPYVEDVQQVSGKNYEVLVTCAGSTDPTLTVTDMKSGKTVKYTKLDARTWSVKVKKGRTYKLSLKVKGQKAKAIKYGVC